MKSLFTLLILLSFSVASSAQDFGVKVGMLGTISTQAYHQQDNLAFWSSMAQVNYYYSGEWNPTFNVGWLRYINKGEGFNQIPLMAGLTYKIDETFYFGGSLGAAFYTHHYTGSSFIISPHVGAMIKRWLSVDARYFTTRKESHNIRTFTVVLSYNF